MQHNQAPQNQQQQFDQKNIMWPCSASLLAPLKPADKTPKFKFKSITLKGWRWFERFGTVSRWSHVSNAQTAAPQKTREGSGCLTCCARGGITRTTPKGQKEKQRRSIGKHLWFANVELLQGTCVQFWNARKGWQNLPARQPKRTTKQEENSCQKPMNQLQEQTRSEATRTSTSIRITTMLPCKPLKEQSQQKEIEYAFVARCIWPVAHVSHQNWWSIVSAKARVCGCSPYSRCADWL